MSNTPETRQTIFSTLTTENRELAKRYIKGVAWYFIHSKDSGEKVGRVMSKIRIIHDDLKKIGLTDEDLLSLEKKAKKFVNTPEKDMSAEQYELLAKLVFL